MADRNCDWSTVQLVTMVIHVDQHSCAVQINILNCTSQFTRRFKSSPRNSILAQNNQV